MISVSPHTLPHVRPTVGPGSAAKLLVATSVQLLQSSLPRQSVLNRTYVMAQLNCDFPALSLAAGTLDSPSREEANQA